MAPGRRQLVCPNHCQPARFEILGGVVVVDERGRYLEHDDKVASFRCLSCGAVALDLAQVPAAQARQRREAPSASVTCPACGSQLLPPDDFGPDTELECPDCGCIFSLEEGSTHLLGQSTPSEEDGEEG